MAARVAVLRIDAHPCGRRCYVVGRRLHHGSAALLTLAAVAACPRRWHIARRVATISAMVALWDDRADFPFRDTDNHERTRRP